MMNCASEKSDCKSKYLKIALMVIVGIAFQGWVVMLLWNWLMPVMFVGAQPIDWLQALGILLLSKILFGGIRGGCHGLWRGHYRHWQSMTPEEREQLKSRHCGHLHTPEK